MSASTVAWRALVARLRHGIGIDYFDLYQLSPQRTAVYGSYVQQRDLELALKAASSDQAKHLCNDKLAFHDACRRHNLATVPVLGVVTASEGNNRHEAHAAQTPGVLQLGCAPDMARVLSEAGVPGVVVKPVAEAHGNGIARYSLHRDGLRGVRLLDTCGDAIEVEALFKRLRDSGSNYLIQPAIAPHDALASLMPSHALGTLRIVTIINGASVSIACACLKVPTGSNVTDNFSGGQAGNLVAAVDVATGAIVSSCGQSPRFPGLMARHDVLPGSDTALTGRVVPDFGAVVELAKRAALAFEQPTSIGWDIAVTNHGPLLLEANWKYDIELVQAAWQRGFRDALRPVLANGASPPASS